MRFAGAPPAVTPADETETNGRRPAAAVGGGGRRNRGPATRAPWPAGWRATRCCPSPPGWRGGCWPWPWPWSWPAPRASGSGLYAVAVNLWLYASIVVDFGLGTWLTREVARRPEGPRDTVGRRPGAAPRPRRLCPAPAAPGCAGSRIRAGLGPGRGAADDGGPAGGGPPAGAVSAGTSLFYAFEDMTFPPWCSWGRPP